MTREEYTQIIEDEIEENWKNLSDEEKKLWQHEEIYRLVMLQEEDQNEYYML